MAATRRRLFTVWTTAILLGTLASCGSRTGLFGEIDDDIPGSDGGFPRDGTVAIDGTLPDATTEDVPGLDVTPRPDVDRRDCPDADATYIYVVTSQNELYSFYPPDLSFQLIGNLVCPAPAGETPFSMAVDRKGVAYVVYTDGSLYRVSTATAACTGTTYKPNQSGFSTFGMGFASDTNGAAERLYVSDNAFDGNLRGLASIDVSTFALSFIGPIDPSIRRSELTGTGDGRLYAFSPTTGASRLVELEKTSGKILGQTTVAVGGTDDAFAFAFWGGDFWFFTSGGGPSEVTRFRPTDNSTVVVTSLGSTIVGAGVSTCAPQL